MALTPGLYPYNLLYNRRNQMGYVSYTELRQNLKKHLDSVCESGAPLVVTRQSGEPVVMLSLAEYESLEESSICCVTPSMRSACCSPSRRLRRGSWSNITQTNEALVER